ncbi:MAG: hypothetical protein HONBIEJF_02092 [Fimbriimonadaceae bacterium]|nr:hypothetical protein [Fimbriimonadaceae bacterium]
MKPMSVITRIGAITALTLAALAGSAQSLTKEQKDQVLARVDEIVTKRAFAAGADFTKWPEFIGKQQKSIDEADEPGEFVNAVNRAFREFGFSHIVMFTPRAADARKTKKMVGMGVRIQVEDDGIRITDVIAKGPAEEAGLQIGDLIIEAEGKKPEGPASFQGEAGTILNIKVKRGQEVKAFVITRREFSTVMPESLTWQSPDVAVLKVPSFMDFDTKRVAGYMDEVRTKAKLLVLDLRSNGGGQVSHLLSLAGMILPREADLGSFIFRDTLDKYKKETGDESGDLAKVGAWNKTRLHPMRSRGGGDSSFKGKIAVLINGGTGSASEMLAAALQENVGAKVIGEKSAGAVLASLITGLPHGFELQYPFMDYVSWKGLRIEGKGVVPEISAATPRFGQPDLGVQAAVDWYKAIAKADGKN